MKTITINVDEYQYTLFRAKVGDRQVSNYIRSYMEVFNNSDDVNLTPDRVQEDVQLRLDYEEAEKAYMKLKTMLQMLESKRNTEEIQNKIKQKKIEEQVRDIKMRTMKEYVSTKAMLGK